MKENSFELQDFDEIEDRIQRIDLEKLRMELKTPIFLQNEKVIEVLGKLVCRLGDKIPQYETILSDDASARLVSLLFRSIIDKKRKDNKLTPVKTFFVAGGMPNTKDKMGESAVGRFIDEHKGAFGKTLLVTEYIHSGKTIEPIVKILEKQGVDFDLATVSVGNHPESYPEDLTRHLVYGEIGGEGGEAFYGGKTFAYRGVHKDAYQSHFRSSAFPEKNNWLDFEKMKDAREDVKLVADELLKVLD